MGGGTSCTGSAGPAAAGLGREPSAIGLRGRPMPEAGRPQGQVRGPCSAALRRVEGAARGCRAPRPAGRASEGPEASGLSLRELRPSHPARQRCGRSRPRLRPGLAAATPLRPLPRREDPRRPRATPTRATRRRRGRRREGWGRTPSTPAVDPGGVCRGEKTGGENRPVFESGRCPGRGRRAIEPRRDRSAPAAGVNGSARA